MSIPNREGLNRFLEPFLKELVTGLLDDQPEEPMEYMVKWIEAKIGVKSKSEKEELFQLRQELSKAKAEQSHEALDDDEDN